MSTEYSIRDRLRDISRDRISTRRRDGVVAYPKSWLPASKAIFEIASDWRVMQKVYKENLGDVAFQGYQDSVRLIMLPFWLLQLKGGYEIDHLEKIIESLGFVLEDYDVCVNKLPEDLIEWTYTNSIYMTDRVHGSNIARQTLGSLYKWQIEQMNQPDYIDFRNIPSEQLDMYRIGVEAGWQSWRDYSTEG